MKIFGAEYDGSMTVWLDYFELLLQIILSRVQFLPYVYGLSHDFANTIYFAGLPPGIFYYVITNNILCVCVYV